MGATLALGPGFDLVSSSRNPAAPSLEESFSAGLPLPCGNNFLSFSILGRWPVGGGVKGEGREGAGGATADRITSC